MMPTEIPTGITPIRGVRIWSTLFGHLSSPVQRAHGGFFWDNATIKARCVQPSAWRRFHDERAAPNENCQCGIYARKIGDIDPSWNRLNLTKGHHVMGEVDLWGKVYEHKRGYRAEYARIINLYDLIDEASLTEATVLDRDPVLLAQRFEVPLIPAPEWVREWVEEPDPVFYQYPKSGQQPRTTVFYDKPMNPQAPPQAQASWHGQAQAADMVHYADWRRAIDNYAAAVDPHLGKALTLWKHEREEPKQPERAQPRDHLPKHTEHQEPYFRKGERRGRSWGT